VGSSRRRVGVALVLDPPLSDQVDGIRLALGDPSLGRIPAHLTLVPPVNIGAGGLSAALARLRAAAAKSHGPIQLTLGSPSTFLPANPVVFLAVGGEIESLKHLRDAVFVPPFQRKLSWPWVPHVTLADGIDDTRIPPALVALDHFAAVMDADRLVLLEQGPGRVWQPIADAALGRPGVVGTGGLAIEITQSRMPDPEARRILELAGFTSDLAGDAGWSSARPPFFPIVMSARREGELAGVAAAWADPHGGHVAVFVEPGVRRQGVGSHLLGHLEAAARIAGWPYATLQAQGPESFYRSRGTWSVATRMPRPRTEPAS
jgi:2'-5' RNA ligase/GNAT superfamily N-acetyltransferase